MSETQEPAMSEMQEPGQSDWVREGAAIARPEDEAETAPGKPVDRSPAVHGTEGGGAPDAGAEEDSAGVPPPGPDGGHRTGPEGS